MKLDLQVSNTQAIVANLYSRVDRLQSGVRALNRQYGAFTRELTQQLAPVDTGYMRDHVREDYSEDGLRWSVGWSAAEFAADGLSFYPVFQEYGTVHMAAQPSLGPAYRAMKPDYEADLSALLKRTIAEGRT